MWANYTKDKLFLPNQVGESHLLTVFKFPKLISSEYLCPQPYEIGYRQQIVYSS